MAVVCYSCRFFTFYLCCLPYALFVYCVSRCFITLELYFCASLFLPTFSFGFEFEFFSTLRLLSHSPARIYTTLCRFICTCFLYFAFTLIVAPTFFFTLHVQLYRNKYTLRRFGLVFFSSLPLVVNARQSQKLQNNVK